MGMVHQEEKFIFARSTWMAAGCPDEGELYNVNRTAKMQCKIFLTHVTIDRIYLSTLLW